MINDKEAERRRAITIGIEQYSDYYITPVGGAINDAQEISKCFKKYGNFFVSDNHFLLGHDATRSNILKAVSEIFRKDAARNDLVAIYFSGHWVLDENNQGYLAPYDMDHEDPYINGINMEELGNAIFKSRNNANVIFLLDCCYSGIANKDTKVQTGIFDAEARNLYSTQLQKIVQPPDEIGAGRTEYGKIILASGEATAVSREKRGCVHSGSKSEPHSHGAFTYYVIEGLEGKAADSDTGIITLENLRRYVENGLIIEERQRPTYMYYSSGSSLIDRIKLAVSLGKFREKIAELINSLQHDSTAKYASSELHDIQYLASAAKKLDELSILDPNNMELPRLRQNIEAGLNAYLQPTMDWLSRNMQVARGKVNEIEPGLYDFKLPDLVLNLSLDTLQNIDQNILDTLIHLGAEVARGTEFKSETDPRLRLFQAKLRASTFAAKSQSTVT